MEFLKKNIIVLFLILVNITIVYADCTEEEVNALKDKVKNIDITYKHLGEITKEDGNKVYNEFIVTAKNIPDNVYVHLTPQTEENFFEENGDLKIKLTTGEWQYYLYSSECDMVIDVIKFKLPTFNLYSLDPLCDGIDGNDFKLCGKYYESNVSREIFERRVKEYKRNHLVINNSEKKEMSKFDTIINFFKTNYIYALIILFIGLVVLFVINMVKKINKRKTL